MFRHGVMLNSGDGLERLADVDTIVFDKTGTLTLPQPSLANCDDITPEELALAGSLALASKHPLARAVAAGECDRPLAATNSRAGRHRLPRRQAAQTRLAGLLQGRGGSGDVARNGPTRR